MSDVPKTRGGLLLEPTLRDLMTQWVGLSRLYSLDPEVRGTRRWSQWLAFVRGIDDERLVAVAKGGQMSLASIILGRSQEVWDKRFAPEYETRDLYRTPGADEREASEALHARRTEGPLRDILAADTTRSFARLAEIEADPASKPIQDFVGSHSATNRPDPSSLSDWDLLTTWFEAQVPLSLHLSYQNRLKRDAAEAAEQEQAPSP